MGDVFTKEKRSEIMRSIRGTNTRPEDAVASYLRILRIRHRRHVKKLPGCPDFLLCDNKVVIFVHGCFWHGHQRCRKGRVLPRTRATFWKKKIEGNIRRDAKVARQLRATGFSVLTIWECKIRRHEMPTSFITALHKAILSKKKGNKR